MKRRFSMTPSRWIAAALGMVCVGAVCQNGKLLRERRELLRECAVARGGETFVTGDDQRAKIALPDLEHAVAEETARLEAAERQLAAMRETLPPIKGEQLRSFGRVDELAREAAAFLPQLADFIKRLKARAAAPFPEDQAEMSKLLAWTTRLEAIGALEENPTEIARFHAATLETRLRLDQETTERVRAQCEEEFIEIKRRGLTRPQRPDDAQEQWYRERKELLNQAAARVEFVIPAERRERHAVGQSLYLGTALRTSSNIGSDGRGSVQMALELPGLEME